MSRLVRLSSPIVFGAVLWFPAGLGCGRPCRAVDVKPVSFACAPSAPFRGERHFDDAATFESFLELECMPEAAAEDVTALVDQVDFTRDAIFVAAGDRAQAGRCVSERKADEVEVCDDGLHVAFADRLAESSACGGTWTVAFALPRAELRAALQDSGGGSVL